MTKWAKVRQKAIDDAKKDVKHNNVEIYHYIEVNLVAKALNEPDAIVVTNSVVKNVNPDYVMMPQILIKQKRHFVKIFINRWTISSRIYHPKKVCLKVKEFGLESMEILVFITMTKCKI